MEILKKYGITTDDLAKELGYFSGNSFRNSSVYKKYIKASEKIAKLIEQSIVNSIKKTLEIE